MSHNLLTVQGISKSYRSSFQDSICVFQNLNITVNQNEIVALLGPSGCGKTTLLNMIAGFEMPDTGEIYLEKQSVTGPGANRGVVFQTPVLFPWLTVQENIAYGLNRRHISKKDQHEAVQEYLSLVHLNGFENYYPNELSGGMQQRAALARTLILHPQLLLMDEPFSALDPVLRFQMQQLVISIWEKLKQTIIFVTHDIEEAMILADRIYIFGKCPRGILEERKVPSFTITSPFSSSLDSPEFIRTKKEIRNILFSCS